ncbi:MAG: diadenylate cyclase CdaA [Bacillota bacterium]
MNFTWPDPLHFLLIAVDLILIYFLIYRGLLLLKGTKAIPIVYGFAILLMIYGLSKLLGLATFAWVLETIAPVLSVAFLIIFQPELRRALEQLGNRRFFHHMFFKEKQQEAVYAAIKEAVENLSNTNTGGLIVLAVNDSLADIVEKGIKLDALLSSELVINIFHPKTPLHDGAVIIQNSRVVAAKCILPLSEDEYAVTKLGTRHLAALGLSEQTDAIVIVVSEESGAVSMARFGELIKRIPIQKVPEFLSKLGKQTREEARGGVRSFASSLDA